MIDYYPILVVRVLVLTFDRQAVQGLRVYRNSNRTSRRTGGHVGWSEISEVTECPYCISPSPYKREPSNVPT